VSRTRKDVSHTKGAVIEVVKREDGTFDLFFNQRLDQSKVEERWLPEWLCVGFGFCGEEYDAILREVELRGKASIKF
jgi:hypothetical protein